MTYNLAFMPYANFNGELKLGGYNIWPFYSNLEQRIKDRIVRSQLKKYFKRFYEYKYYRDKGGKDIRLESIYIITPENFTIGKDSISDQQKKDIFSLSNIIAFSSIFETGLGHQTIDAFVVFFQNFTKNREGLSVWNKHYTKYNLFKIMKPIHVDSPFLPFYKTKLCDVLAYGLHLRSSNQNLKNIYRSLELLFHTITFGEMITNEHRLLTLLMAFETLLQFENKIEFVKFLEKYIHDLNPILTTRLINRSGVKQIKVKKSKTSWWAYDLYNLRTQIIHGEDADWKITEYGDIWTRIKFAGLLFRRIYKNVLEENNLWKSDFIEGLIEAFDFDSELVKIMDEFKEMNPELYPK